MKRVSLFVLGAMLVLSSCKNDKLDVDVSAISVPEVRIMRFDKAFFALDTARLSQSLQHLHVEYGDFADGYVNNIICSRAPDSLSCNYAIIDFLYNRNIGMRDVYLECSKVFPDSLSDLEDQLTDAFKHFRYYFPDKKLPHAVYATMTGFNYNIFNVQGDYGISLEFYLGKDNNFYDALPDLWPAYRRRVSSKEYMAVNFVKAWLMNEFPYNPARTDLINKMVYEGKYYGTLRSELQRIWNLDQVPLLDIDVKGAIHVQQQFPHTSLSIFIEPPSVGELKRRLESRGTETAESLKDRVNKAAYEISFKQHFDHCIVNDNLDRACQQAEEIVANFIKTN